jgi:hypothetical protein
MFVVLVINMNFEYLDWEAGTPVSYYGGSGFESRLGDPIIVIEDCRNFTLLLQTTNAVVIIK